MLNRILRKTTQPGLSREGAVPPGGAPDAAEMFLFQGVRQGRQKSFEELYRLYHPRLQRFLLHMIRQGDQVVEEVLNDTMMVVWRRADAFDGRSKLSTWIFGIAYRKALKALSRQDLPADDSDLPETADSAPGPESAIGFVQLRRRLQEAMSALSVDHRAVVELCYFQDMSHAEIAEIVGCPPETVKTRMFYARRRLRGLLEDLGE
ncbi:sigma-70 family RNA polymerase sigma factor [Paucibacter sp. R3-3]|uniref:Sigma-70 family RNA polymerase sigma factor n=1 Tax=Roseateles agri TaxID=3098619 RepID=A0ABU5DTJ2_9BURK|nr:sigma-70 family RNA polymerase sigma factor [Paucibacter sp. R3-3]MDY0748784.1 sigma-70 family RNA polymerase sigma factor [Paucibacter sp. R3-3]